MKLKTFKDLEFGPHPVGQGKMAQTFFPNGYGVSVVRFTIGGMGVPGSYTTGDEWELAVLIGEEKDWDLCYSTPITEDVIGHLTDSEVTDYMRQIQELPNAKKKK